MDLAQNIQNYYFDHIAELPNDKQFHYATRIGAWFGDERAHALLHNLRKDIIPEGTSLQDVFSEILHRPQTGTRNAHARREPYFDRFPELYGVHLALFRLRHMNTVYGLDAREDFFAVYSEPSLRALCDRLMQDADAVRVLSTFAVNTLYLTHGSALKDNLFPRDELYAIGSRGYDLAKRDDIQLFIYLYTHCIIGESNFYAQPIHPDALPVYMTMLEKLETVIEGAYEQINLDNKLEFLVCARICDFRTNLSERIYAECEASISPEGMFIIDVHNKNIQQDRMSFEKSEHRNVLYLMSTASYSPQPHSV